MTNFLKWLFGERTVAIQCEFCEWEKNDYYEPECSWCKQTGLITFKTFIPEYFKNKFKVCWIK